MSKEEELENAECMGQSCMAWRWAEPEQLSQAVWVDVRFHEAFREAWDKHMESYDGEEVGEALQAKVDASLAEFEAERDKILKYFVFPKPTESTHWRKDGDPYFEYEDRPVVLQRFTRTHDDDRRGYCGLAGNVANP
jgi:hypothetical protein